jgi:hypothetical protein
MSAPAPKRVKTEEEEWEEGPARGTWAWHAARVRLRSWGYDDQWIQTTAAEVLREMSPRKFEAASKWMDVLSLGIEPETRVSVIVVLMGFQPAELLECMEKFARKADKIVEFFDDDECVLDGYDDHFGQHLPLGPFTLDAAYGDWKPIVFTVWKAIFGRMPDNSHWPAAIAVARQYLQLHAAGPLSDEAEKGLRQQLCAFYKTPANLEDIDLKQLLELVMDGEDVECAFSPMWLFAHNLMI